MSKSICLKLLPDKSKCVNAVEGRCFAGASSNPQDANDSDKRAGGQVQSARSSPALLASESVWQLGSEAKWTALTRQPAAIKIFSDIQGVTGASINPLGAQGQFSQLACCRAGNRTGN